MRLTKPLTKNKTLVLIEGKANCFLRNDDVFRIQMRTKQILDCSEDIKERLFISLTFILSRMDCINK